MGEQSSGGAVSAPHAVLTEVDRLIAAGDLDRARVILRGAMAGPQAALPWVRDRWFLVDPAWHACLSDTRVRLRPPAASDLSFFLSCFADGRFMHSFHRLAGMPRDGERMLAVLRAMPWSVVRGRAAHWVIERTTSLDGSTGSPVPVPVGILSLVDILVAHRRAEILVGLPGKPSPGIAVRSSLLLVEHAFRTLGLHKLTSIVVADNPHSQRSTLSLGFRQEGFRREHLRDPRSGRLLDCHENGLIGSEHFADTRVARLRERFARDRR
jgi:RimJ/RimL family protein N-acetyltransferase